MTPNGKLPDFILSPDEAGIWRIVDRHGNLFAGGNRYLRGRALLSLLQEAGANYKIINPSVQKRKANTMLARQIETITTDTDASLNSDILTKKKGDARFIAVVLADSDMDWTIENAQAILAKGRANKPLAWTITPEELPAMWAELVDPCPTPR